MADGFGNKYLKDFVISSAGTHPEKVNQNAVNVMKKIGIDISNNQSNKIDLNQLSSFDYIITLCGDARDRCLNLSEYKNLLRCVFSLTNVLKIQYFFEYLHLCCRFIYHILY